MREVLRHFFVPHEGNNHRAKALHVDALLFYLIAFGVFNVGLKFMSQKFPDVLAFATNIQVQELLSQTNAKRLENGLPALTFNEALSQAAAKKAQDMFGKNYWAHVAPDGKTPWDFILSSGYRYTVAGENLAKNFADSQGVVNAWMASPSHKDNLLKSNYKEVGFAVVNGKLLGEETTLVVQMFGTRTVRALAEAPPEKEEEPMPQLAVVPEVAPEERAVEVPVVASVFETKTEKPAHVFPFGSVISLPMVDIATLRRDASVLFAGMIIGVLLLDLWIAARKKTIRAVGSTVAHVLFFVAILLSTNMILRGSIL